MLITFLVRQVRCPQLVEGTFPLSYYSFWHVNKVIIIIIIIIIIILSQLSSQSIFLYKWIEIYLLLPECYNCHVTV